MSTTLKSKIALQMGWAWRDRSGSYPVSDTSRFEFQLELDNGSAPGQADAVWRAEGRALGPSEVEILYLDQLATTLFRNTLTTRLAKVKALLVINRSAVSGGELVVGGAATDEWHAPFGAFGDTVRVPPGSPLLLCNTGVGWDVTPSARALALRASGGVVTYDIAILGVLETEPSSSSASSESSV